MSQSIARSQRDAPPVDSVSKPAAFQLVGVIHLAPLPAAPRGSRGLQAVIDRAIADAQALVSGGIHAAIIENIGDAPFSRHSVPPHVPAAMAVVADRVRQAMGGDLQLGINVLRNDAVAALGVAVATGARFVRVNVLAGAAWTDQGLIEGDANGVLRYRRELGAQPAGPLDLRQPGAGVSIVADVFVKHAVPLGWGCIEDAARDSWKRGGADVLVVTGVATGASADADDVDRVRQAVPDAIVWVGSGVRSETAGTWARHAHGAIVGTALHRDGQLEQPLDVDRVRRLVDAVA